MIPLCFAIAWLACAVASYFVWRSIFRAEGAWTKGTRASFALLSCLTGPFSLFLGTVEWAANNIDDKWTQEPANW